MLHEMTKEVLQKGVTTRRQLWMSQCMELDTEEAKFQTGSPAYSEYIKGHKSRLIPKGLWICSGTRKQFVTLGKKLEYKGL